jgi:CheY-like chemotaxis protein
MERPRILVVEDEPNARSALRELLDEAGYDVAVAGSGVEGLALLDTFHPQVLLTDVATSAASGLSLSAASRRRPDSPRVVFMSASARRGDEPGVWLAKPIDVDDLLRTLDGIVHVH